MKEEFDAHFIGVKKKKSYTQKGQLLMKYQEPEEIHQSFIVLLPCLSNTAVQALAEHCSYSFERTQK